LYVSGGMRPPSVLGPLGRAWESTPYLRLLRSSAQKLLQLRDDSLFFCFSFFPQRGEKIPMKRGGTFKFLYVFSVGKEALEHSADLCNGLGVWN